MIGFYNIDDLVIGTIIIMKKEKEKFNCIPLEKKLILSRIDGACNSWQYKYEEIFTKIKYRVLMNEENENEIFVIKTEKLNNYLTEVEQKTKKISKYRLSKIYNMINQLENTKEKSKTKKYSLYSV